MTNSKPVFSYKEAISQLCVIPFVRIKSTDGKFSYDLPNINDRDLLGFSAFDILPTDQDGCLDIVHWSDRDNFIQTLQESAEKLTPSHEHFRVVLSTGEIKWLYGTATPKKRKNGDIVWMGFWIDVTKEKRKDYFNTLILNSLPESVVVFDKQGIIIAATPKFCGIVFKDEKELIGKSLISILPENLSDTLQQYLLLSTLKEKTVFNETLKREGLSSIDFEIEVVPKDNFFICVFRDTTAYNKKLDHYKHMAYYDAESGVENYAFLKDLFPKIVDQAKITQTQIAVLSITPDNLGQINAISGRLMNSKLIAAVAERIRSCLDIDDYMAWTSAHHVTVLLTGIEFSIEIERKVDRILRAFDSPVYIDDLEFDLAASIGVCFYPQNGKNLDDLMARADLALEQARIQNSASMRLYSSEFSLSAEINRNMRKNLKVAIENGDIKAYFQPQVDIKTGQIIGLEALARWKSEEGLLIPPAQFIPEAEEHGLIDALTETMLDQACSWNQKWYSMGLCRIPVAVNISARQFHNESQLLRMVNKALDINGLPPYLLELELTESSAMFDPRNAQHIIQTLLDNNIRCALDDFGTGYSSLSVLRSFPIKKLKIDRSFVLDLKEKKNLEIVRATIAMAHALNLQVLAEGVETRQAFEILKDLNCDVIQGYLFAQPLSAEETELLLMRWDAGEAVSGHGF